MNGNNAVEQQGKKVKEMIQDGSKTFLVASKWVLRNIKIIINACLISNQKTRILRGHKIQSSQDVIYKSILIDKKNLSQYQKIVKKAIKYYERFNVYRNNQPPIQYYLSDQYLHQNKGPRELIYFRIIRPYFRGRNFHQEIFIYRKLPYDIDQFHVYAKQALNILHMDFGDNFYIPSLDNVYFDGVGLQINCTSFQTLLFLEGTNKYLSTERFKQLYFLLSSDENIFVDWSKMSIYLKEQIKVKAFLVMLFCFITKRSPIQMIWQQKIDESDLEWIKIRSEVNQNNKSNYKANNSNKLIQLIKEIPKKWQSFLNNVQIEQLLRQFSKKIHQKDKFKNQPQKSHKQIDQNYFYKLFYKVFVEQNKLKTIKLEQIKKYSKNVTQIHSQRQQQQKISNKLITYFGWKDLFQKVIQQQNQKIKQKKQSLGLNKATSIPIIKSNKLFQFIQWSNKDQEQKQMIIKMQQQKLNQKLQAKLQEYRFQKQQKKYQTFLKRKHAEIYSKHTKMEVKTKTAKEAFLLLHKYFAYKDIKLLNLQKKEQQEEFLSHLHFQTYVPLKIGLSLQHTLIYEEWFQIFFTEFQDYRTAVFKATCNLKDIIDEQAQQMLKRVKRLQLYHLKRIRYLLALKMFSNKAQEQILKHIKFQLSQHLKLNRLIQLPFQKLRSEVLRRKQFAGDQMPNEEQKKKLLNEIYPINSYPQLNLLLQLLIEIFNQETKTSVTLQDLDSSDPQELRKSIEYRLVLQLDRIGKNANKLKFSQKVQNLIEKGHHKKIV